MAAAKMVAVTATLMTAWLEVGTVVVSAIIP